jgi:phosphoglycolate phosphatase-like HAD superfamily hydrolase
LSEGEVIEAFKDLVGLSRREVAVGLMRRFGLEDAARNHMVDFGVDRPWQAYVQMRLRIYEALLADPNIVLAHRYRHNITLLCEVRRKGYSTALATQSHRAQARLLLDILGLADEFDARLSMATLCGIWSVNKANPQEVYSHRSALRRAYRRAVEALVPPYLPLGLDW